MRGGQSSHSCCVGAARRTNTPTLRLPLTNIPRSQKSNHPTCSHPSCAHNAYTQNHGWGEQSTGKCGTQLCLLGWLMKLRKKSTRTHWYPKTCRPIQSTTSRTKAKVGVPRTENRSNPRKKKDEGRNGPHPCQPKKRHDLPAISRRCIS